MTSSLCKIIANYKHCDGLSKILHKSSARPLACAHVNPVLNNSVEWDNQSFRLSRVEEAERTLFSESGWASAFLLFWPRGRIDYWGREVFWQMFSPYWLSWLENSKEKTFENQNALKALYNAQVLFWVTPSLSLWSKGIITTCLDQLQKYQKNSFILFQ